MKTIKKIMILLNIAFLLLMDLPRASAITETSGNSLSFSLSIDESCKELIQLAECYSLKGGQYSVYNSKNQVVGVFETDDDGVGRLLGSDAKLLQGLADDTYTIKMTKSIEGFSFDEKIYQVTLQSDKHKVDSINVNTVTSLYGKNEKGAYFSNNQYKLWTVDYGTGIFECGIAQADSPCGIKEYGSHTLDVSDGYLLDRNGYTNAGYSNELIYKIMYYGRNGEGQWAGFNNYPTPFMSRNGSTQYSGSYSGQTALAAFITHVALSRCWGKDNGKWALQSDIAGFKQFWSYVTSSSTANAPDDFLVYVWPHSLVCKQEQDMFFGYTLTKTDYETKHISATISAGFDPIRIILTKQSTDKERIADAQFTMTYYNKDLIDANDSENYSPLRSWTFKTDENGSFFYLDDWKVAGDELFNYQGDNILLPGTYIVSETKVPDGYCKAEDFMIKVKPVIGKAVTFYKSDGKTVINNKIESGYLLTELKQGYLQVHKVSDCDYFDSSAFINCRYGLFLDSQCQQLAKINNSDEDAILIINNDGYSQKIEIAVGEYYLKEIKAPDNFALDQTVYPIEIGENENVVIECVDKPIFDKVSILLKKEDEKTSQAVSDCQFTVKFYKDKQYESLEQLDGNYDKKWIFKTNSAGLIDLNDPDCFVDGDQLYYYQGNTVLLNGTYHFTENYSPQGYQAVEDFLIYHHNQSTQEKIVDFNPITVKEKWKLMVQVAKLDENENYLSGAKLQLLSDKYRLITSFVSLDSPIDISQYVQEGESYILREEEAPEGYQLSEDIIFKVEPMFNQYTTIKMVDYPICTIETKAISENNNQFVQEGEKLCHDIVHIEKMRSNYPYILVSKLFNVNDLNNPIDTVETEISSASNQLEVKIDFAADFERGSQYIIFQYLYDKKGNLIASHQDINDEKQKLYCPAIDTYCYDKKDSDKFILPSQSVQIIDEIDFDALIKSEVYTIVSQLIDLSSNQIVATSSKEFLYDGQKVNAEISYQQTGQSNRYVVTEQLYHQGVLIGSHIDLFDADQMIYCPSMTSNCYKSNDSDKYLTADNKTITDEITYNCLIDNKLYQLQTHLVDYNSNEVVKKVTNDIFLKDGNGSFSVNIDCLDQNRKKLVLFQYLYCDGNLIATDADINNENQTIYVPELSTNASIVKISNDKAIIKDEIFLSGLKENENYRAVTALYSHADDKILDLSWENDFIFANDQQNVSIFMEIDGKLLIEDSLTVLQQIYDKNGNLIIEHQNINDDNQTVTVNDIEIEVTKIDSSNKKALADCTIGIYKKDGTIARDINGNQCITITNADGKAFFILPYASEGYYLKEIKAPDKYQKKDDIIPISFEIEQSKIMKVEIELTNDKLSNTGDLSDITIMKYTTMISLILLITGICVKKVVVGTD